MEAKIHWNKQFSYDTFVAPKCPSRSWEGNCWISHPMFSKAKHFFSVMGMWMLATFVQFCRLQLDCQLHFCWTQHPSRSLLWRKGLLKTILVSEDDIKFLLLANKRSANEMLIGIVCISFSITWRLVSKPLWNNLCLLQINTAPFSEILATYFDSIAVRLQLLKSFDVMRYEDVSKTHQAFTRPCWVYAGLRTSFVCAWVQWANTWSSVWLCCIYGQCWSRSKDAILSVKSLLWGATQLSPYWKPWWLAYIKRWWSRLLGLL